MQVSISLKISDVYLCLQKLRRILEKIVNL